MRATRTVSVARKGRPAAEDARKKVAKVLAVATNEFSELGYRAVTMRGVAEKARVSTRTLYNRYADKLSLYTACLDFGAQAFPQPAPAPGESPDAVLQRYAVEIVQALSSASSLRLSMLIYREGSDFPELLRAGEEHEDRFLLQPLASYLRHLDIESEGSDERAKLFISMALSEWQRRIAYRRRTPKEDDVNHHAAFVVKIFLHGADPHGGKAG